MAELLMYTNINQTVLKTLDKKTSDIGSISVQIKVRALSFVFFNHGEKKYLRLYSVTVKSVM